MYSRGVTQRKAYNILTNCNDSKDSYLVSFPRCVKAKLKQSAVDIKEYERHKRPLFHNYKLTE